METSDKLYKKPLYIDRFSEKFFCPTPINCNPYLGCSHNCTYCYAKFMQEAKRLWRPIRPADVGMIEKHFRGAMSGKLNSVMHKLIRRKVPVRFASMTDGFQPCEQEFQVSRQLFELFAELQYPIVMGVKGALIRERPYLDLLKQFPHVVQVTIITDNDILSASLEPGAPHSSERLEMLRTLCSEGINAQLRIAPLIPTMNEYPISLIEKAIKAGAKEILTQWMKWYPSPIFLDQLNRVVGYNLVSRIKQSGISIEKMGNALMVGVEYMRNSNAILAKTVYELGADFLPTPDIGGSIIGPRCCCGLDKYPGFEGLLSCAFRMNQHRIRDHTSFDQFMYGYADHPYLKDVFDYWNSGAFCGGIQKDYTYHPESSTYSRLSVLANNMDKA